MKQDIKNGNTEYLFSALAAVNTPSEVEALLDDLCTIGEVQEMSNRIAAARMLAAGSTYNEICEATGLSTATVTRVNRALKYGSGGYKLILKRIERRGE